MSRADVVSLVCGHVVFPLRPRLACSAPALPRHPGPLCVAQVQQPPRLDLRLMAAVRQLLCLSVRSAAARGAPAAAPAGSPPPGETSSSSTPRNPASAPAIRRHASSRPPCRERSLKGGCDRVGHGAFAIVLSRDDGTASRDLAPGRQCGVQRGGGRARRPARRRADGADDVRIDGAVSLVYGRYNARRGRRAGATQR